jgi:hypothetical protein
MEPQPLLKTRYRANVTEQPEADHWLGYDGRFAIDNGAAERAIRPIAVGRATWLQVLAEMAACRPPRCC